MEAASGRGTSLRSREWSCSELVTGAEVCANMAGLSLTTDPSQLSRAALLQSIQENVDRYTPVSILLRVSIEVSCWNFRRQRQC